MSEPFARRRSLGDFVATEGQSIVEACTRCGECVRACPVLPFGAGADALPDRVAGGIIDLLASGRPLSETSAAWLETCNGCGLCIPVCPEQINPRKMIALAAARAAQSASKTPDLFRRMSRAVKIMAGMQLLPDEFKRVFSPPRERKADLVFYLGCNALRTPHLLFNSMAVLDALGADYAVVGGPSSCCGVIATKWEGRIEIGERDTNNTMINRFNGFRPDKVLNRCPTCQLHLDETLSGYRSTNYELDHLTEYLVANISTLR